MRTRDDRTMWMGVAEPSLQGIYRTNWKGILALHGTKALLGCHSAESLSILKRTPLTILKIGTSDPVNMLAMPGANCTCKHYYIIISADP